MTDPYGRNFAGNEPPKGPKLFNPFRVFRYFLYLPLAFLRYYLKLSNFWKSEIHAMAYLASWATLAAACIGLFSYLGAAIGFGVIGGTVFTLGFLYAGFHLDDDARWQLLKDKLLK